MTGTHTHRALRRGDRRACCTPSSMRCSIRASRSRGCCSSRTWSSRARAATSSLGRGGGVGDAAHAAPPRAARRPRRSSSCPAGRTTCRPPSISTRSTGWTAPKPWKLSFSYGRALQDEAMAAWAGPERERRRRASALSITAPSATAPPRWAGTATRWRAKRLHRVSGRAAHAPRPSIQHRRRHAVAHAVSTRESGVTRAKGQQRQRQRPWTRGQQGAHPARTALRAGARADERVLARLQLPLGRDDLPEGQPAAAPAAAGRRHQAPAARPLGREPGAVVRVGAPEPADRQERPRRDLRRRARPRRARRARPDLPRGHLFGDLPGQEPGRGGDAEVLQAVLLPRPHRQSRHARDARTRSTRAASSATACRTRTAWRSTTPI